MRGTEMAGKGAIQKLIDQYTDQIAEHQRAIESAKQFIDALRATQKAKARVEGTKRTKRRRDGEGATTDSGNMNYPPA
jgi:hypothetical protein